MDDLVGGTICNGCGYDRAYAPGIGYFCRNDACTYEKEQAKAILRQMRPVDPRDARIQALETSLAEAEGRVKWVFPKSIADMPVKPGKSAYEYVECLILRKGEMLCRPWNCEHQVFDDEAQDDFFCEWSEVTAYMDLTAIRALADPLLDRQGKEGV